MPIERPRPLDAETPLREGTQVLVAAPRSEHGRKAAERIQEAMQGFGAAAALVPDPSEEALVHADGPVFVVGNLADSQCVRGLYFRFLCATDLWYPGPKGFELRTLCNPLNTGHNVILVGYSDDAGAKNAADRLLARLGDPLPHLFDLKVTRLPLSGDQISQCYSTVFDEAQRKATNNFGHKRGYLYYLTGEPWLGEEYRKTWQALLEYGYDRPGLHLGGSIRWTPWRLVEDTGLFSDDERLAVMRWFCGWAEGSEGWRYVMACPRCKDEYITRMNHELVPAEGLAFLGDYVAAHHPEVKEAAKWREVAAHVFKPYGPHWKPICDGLCNGWWASQTAMMDYALTQPHHSYFEMGGARQIADYAVACINNDGWFPSAGNSGISRQFPDPVLRMAGAYYKDGRYEWPRKRVSPERRLGWHVIATRAFDAGLEPIRPDEFLGVTVIPMDPLVYNVWDKNPQIAHEAATTPPNMPLEQCFDKIAIRAGWELEDDYLLIDGLGGGHHSYDDAASVLDYQRLGISVIVAHDGLFMSAPEEHSFVTIVRDGEACPIPAFPALEANETDADGNVYLRIRSKDYAGADWIREVHFLPGRCVVFVDTVEAQKPGEYAVETHFRTPAKLEIEGAEARCRRHTPTVGEVTFRIASSCDASELRVIEKPMETSCHTDEQRYFWRLRHYTDEVCLTSLCARKAVRMKPGDALTMVHLAQVVAPGESEIAVTRGDMRIAVSDGTRSWDLKTTAAMKSVERAHVAVAPSRELKPAQLFEADSPIVAMCRLSDGRLFAGTESGAVHLLDEHGSEVWAARLTGCVHDVGVAEGDETALAAGHGPEQISGFNLTGDRLWTTDMEFQLCPWPWWQMATAAAVQVKGGVEEGEPFFIAGTGDIHFRRIDRHGRQVWVERFDVGVPGRLRVLDVDGTGRPTIVVGGDILAERATVRLFTSAGKLLHKLEVEGCVSTYMALTFAAAGRRRWIACGTNRGKNLHLYERSRDSGDWKRLWLKQLGGQVTGIHLFAAQKRLVAGTSQAFLLGYDLEGARLWGKLCAHGIRDMAPFGEGVLISDDAGGLGHMNACGDELAACVLPEACSILQADEPGALLACGQTIWRLEP